LTVFLEAVSDARKLRDLADRNFREALVLRDLADRNFREALVRAQREGHSLSELGRAAGLTRAGVAYLLRRERGEKR